MRQAFYDHVIFDLDGTLTDSKPGIYNAISYMTDKIGLPKPDENQLKGLIGPPLQKGIFNVFQLEGENNRLAVDAFREYYVEKGIYENIPYPGIEDLLEDLYNADVALYLATSKLEMYAKKILEYFNIAKYFSDISGADYDGRNADKERLVFSILQRNSISSPEKVVMIGDSKYDLDAAATMGIDSIGVTYGFSTRGEIESHCPDYLATSVNDLRSFLLTSRVKS